jgi:phytoene dehydrogenase-like protein
MIEMPAKFIIIIGAGLGGLATGCYAQMNGFKTKIFEMQEIPGGVCVSWKRKGYTFDYAVHNVFGITPNSANNHLWRELGALEGLKTHSFGEFVQIEDSNRKVFTVYSNVEKLSQHLKEVAPNDQKLINEFIKAIRKFSGYDLFAGMSGGTGTKIKMLPLMGSLVKYSKITLKDYAEQFTDPFLRKAFATIQYDIAEVPVIVPLIFLATLNQKDGGWPMGGSKILSKNIEQRYLKLGGEVTYRSKVKKILVKDDVAVGVQLEDGTEHLADIVVSDADGYSTIYEMLDGKYINETINAYYKAFWKKEPFGLEIFYGVAKEFQGEPHSLVLFLDEPIIVEGIQRDRLSVEIFNFDPSLAPPRKTVVKVVFDSDYEYWKNLSVDKQSYQGEKQKITKLVAQTLEKRFPNFEGKVEATDVVTPISVEHFTGAYKGSQAWSAPKEYMKKINKNGVSKTLPGLQNFYMVGQWAIGTIGLNTVCLSGRNLVRELSKKEKIKFIATTE